MKNPAYPIHGNTNLAIAAAAISVNLGALWTAAHAPAWWTVALAALVFSLSNNTVFSLHHEAVHGGFHPNRRVNEAAGTLLAAFFPTIFSIQRVSHLGHHRRNRTDEELYDYTLPGQSWALKTYWIYCLLTGFYWAIIPLAGLVYLVCPWSFRARWFQDGPARWWGFRPFVADIARAPIPRVWLEGAFTLGLQAALIAALDLSWASWLACYWAFGVNWSSVQYTDHAGSPRDVVEGAWNLRFLRVTQAVFLNYNLHLAHHREPGIPWIHLPRRVRKNDPNPGFWGIYLRLFLGARPAPAGRGPEPLEAPNRPSAGAAMPALAQTAATLLCALVLGLALLAPASAQDTGTPADHDALRKLRGAAMRVVNERDYDLAGRILEKPFMATVATQDAFTDLGKLRDYFEHLYTRDYLRMKDVKISIDPDDFAEIHTGTFAIAKGGTKEHYELVDGRVFDMDGRWTAVALKTDDEWKILALHQGIDFLDNPVLGAIERSAKWVTLAGVLVGLLAGLAAGFALGWFAKRRRPGRAGAPG